MFSSIKWKFIVVYFLLVFIAMVIVGIFIISSLENQQIANISSSMEQKIETILRSSSYLSEDDWVLHQEEIQETIEGWRSGNSEVLYAIYEDQAPLIIATTSRQSDKILGINALSYKLDPSLIIKAYGGEKATGIIKDPNENTIEYHIAYPSFTSIGQVKGVIYMTSNLENVYLTVNESKRILTNATIIALLITVFLGFLIASSITVPIRDVTIKAGEMAKGDFEQFVEVKSDDEIGQLANMFNILTLRLKNTIEAMDLERSKLDTIFSYMAEGVLAIDKEGRIIHANPIAMEILDLNDLDSKIEVESLNIRKIDYLNETTLTGEENFQLKDHVYKIKYASFKNEANNVAGLIIVFQDITKEHKLDNLRKEFVANVSHELKTPLTTIKSYTETLMDGDIDMDTEVKFLNVINDECDRMARLVKDLLQLSNLDCKKTSWKKENVDLARLLNKVLENLDLVFKEKNQDLIVDIDKSIPNIYVDKDGLEQVLVNIISNSIKYTEENGRIKVSLFPSDDQLILRVEDNGIGIPPEDQGRIFERFYRVEKGRSRQAGGTGLGLAIAKQIIEDHGGQIKLTSSASKGTLVDIILPCNNV